MARRRKKELPDSNGVQDFRHEEAKRKNNPPVGLAPTYEARERETRRYAYDPHLDPALQFDASRTRAEVEAIIDRGLAAESLEKAKAALKALKKRQDAYLNWAGKAEHTSFEVDVVSLHIHERLSTRAILEAARKPETQLKLFGETELKPHEQIEFYRHDVNWANRLILGDSLLVMNSLLVKEGMAGKVQMIYMDPPYGIKYASNFQPRIDHRDVKDQDADLTHEPEQIKAYRDTWKLGIHSYLSYLRDRLLLSRDLLCESGSIFIQISDDNLHLVRNVLDELFGKENFCSIIVIQKTGGLVQKLIPRTCDYLLWYAKQKEQLKFYNLYLLKPFNSESQYNNLELKDGTRRHLNSRERIDWDNLPEGSYIFQPTSTESANPKFEFNFKNDTYFQRWKTNPDGLRRLAESDKIDVFGKTIRYIRYYSDFPYVFLSNVWDDIMGERDMLYAVQTNTKIIERCLLMTTDPGDLVLDPTCGSGTTAFCAEKWGRRWITCDTSRVALAIARQRLLTAKFDYYELKDPTKGPAGGFIYEEVPHITLESIAKNTEIDEIAARFNPQTEAALAELNRALKQTWREWQVPREVPHPLWPPEAHAAYQELHQAKQTGLAAVSMHVEEGLQTIYRLTGHQWKSLAEVPDPVPAPDWPEEAQAALRRFWELKRAKRQEIDASIQRNAPRETLYDRPRKRAGVVRVSGPFTVEAIPAPMVTDPAAAPIPQFEEEEARARVSDRGGDYLTDMLNLLQAQGGVLFPGGKKLALQNLRRLSVGLLHAEGEAAQNGKPLRVALSFGPQYGPLTAFQVQEAIPTAKVNGYEILIFAGFSFDPEAQAFIQKAPVAGMEVHFAHIAPDVLVGDLLKTNRASQIFTVFGQPDVKVTRDSKQGTYVVELLGVDIYDPLTGETHHTRGNQVAAWFLDTDYDGQTFHICQAFFPGDPDAWKKLEKALKARIDPKAFEQMRGTISFAFKPGEHQRIAVKVINFRGNEVLKIINLYNWRA